MDVKQHKSVDLATSIKHCTAKLQSLIAQSRLTVSGSAAGQVLLLPKGESLSFPSVKRTVMIYYYTQPYKNYIIILSTKIILLYSVQKLIYQFYSSQSCNLTLVHSVWQLRQAVGFVLYCLNAWSLICKVWGRCEIAQAVSYNSLAVHTHTKMVLKMFADNLSCFFHSFSSKESRSGRMLLTSQNLRYRAVGMMESRMAVSATARLRRFPEIIVGKSEVPWGRTFQNGGGISEEPVCHTLRLSGMDLL